MKKLILILKFTAAAAFACAQGVCGNPVPQSAAAGFNCSASSFTNFIPANSVTVPINFIFLQPTVGIGKFDTITKGTCDGIINFMNSNFSGLSAPTLPLPSPYTAPANFTDAKIRFTFKSMSFTVSPQYGTEDDSVNHSVPAFPSFPVTDPSALNLVFNVFIRGGVAGSSYEIPSNMVRLNQDSSGFNLFDIGTRHLYFLHEVGHALGLIHTNEPLTFANPIGTILPNPPMDDYWLEDTATFQSEHKKILS